MKLGDLIYSMITLALMILVFASPALRKMFRSAEKNTRGEAESSEDALYDSVDSRRVVDRMLSRPSEEESWELSQPALKLTDKSMMEEKRISPALERIESLPSLKKAVLWSEILGTPVGMRSFED